MIVSCLNYSFARTGVGALSAIYAYIRIDHVDWVAFADSFDRAHFLARATGGASVSNFVRHLTLLAQTQFLAAPRQRLRHHTHQKELTGDMLDIPPIHFKDKLAIRRPTLHCISDLLSSLVGMS